MKRLVTLGLVGAVLVVIGAFVWFNFIRDDAPDAFELTDEATSGETADPSTEEPAATPESLDGTWVLAEGSEAGYRVVEDIGNIQDFEAVGRTTMVTGSIAIAGTAVTEGSLEVDISTIASDDGRRDGAFQETMAVGQFPTATFVLTGPIELGSIPASGQSVTATASGDLTMRGVTNSVTFPVEAQLLGDKIEIVGAIDVAFSDYDIANPSNPFVSVRDEGKVEVKLVLTKG